MHPCIFLLPVLFHHGVTWTPARGQPNRWQTSTFMYPRVSALILDENSFNQDENSFNQIYPGSTLDISNHMFDLYLDRDDSGVKEPEDFIEYYRHDLGINLFHYHWHNANPFDGALVHNHRRGESFYYMHQQMLARYNVERLANGEAPIPSIHDVKELEYHIEKKYNLPRYDKPADGTSCGDSYSQMQTWTNNIIDAIIQGFAIGRNNVTIEIDVDLLGNMIQPSSKTPDGQVYGNIHNMGHNNIAYCHYKGNKKLNIQLLSDLGDTRTAPRCPVFYRFHTYVDDMFKIHQNKLPEYTKHQLDYPGVELKGLKIITDKGTTNTLHTYWQSVLIDNLYVNNKLTKEYDIPVHLQHEDFKYEITIENNSGEKKVGMVRIFLTPRYDVNGEEISLSAQRSLFIELDKFRIKFPSGTSVVEREAADSVVTVSFDQVFRQILKRSFSALDPEEANFCACGWPDYFLLPSGTAKGMPFYLFAMISEEPDDWADSVPDFRPPNPRAIKRTSCKEAFSYCGLMETVYPDQRPMGYPWDRPAPKWASSLFDFLTPNMIVQEIVIQHVNITMPANVA